MDTRSKAIFFCFSGDSTELYKTQMSMYRCPAKFLSGRQACRVLQTHEKMRNFFQCVETSWLYRVGENFCRSPTAIKWPMAGRNNPLTPNDPYMGRTAPLTSKRCILYIYSTNIGTEYFKHALHSPFFLFKMQFVS